jgi:hypothetical protein
MTGRTRLGALGQVRAGGRLAGVRGMHCCSMHASGELCQCCCGDPGPGGVGLGLLPDTSFIVTKLEDSMASFNSWMALPASLSAWAALWLRVTTAVMSMLQGRPSACMAKGSSRVDLEESMQHIMVVFED